MKCVCQPRLADFGLSRLVTEHKSHVSEAAMGTINYMPPEMLEHQRLTKAVGDGRCCVCVTAVGPCCPIGGDPAPWGHASLQLCTKIRGMLLRLAE